MSSQAPPSGGDGPWLRLRDIRPSTADAGELTNVAANKPNTARKLYEIVRREAGGDLPYYTDLPW